MRNVNVHLFLPNVKTDFTEVAQKDELKKKEAVRYLFEHEFIGHAGTKSYDPKATFEAYFSVYQASYSFIDLNHDGKVELIFNGFIDTEKDIESLEVFMQVKNEWLPIFNGKGNLIGYKIHPNTGEIMLYQHVYPCCNHGSHNLNRLRLVKNQMQETRRFFVGRDDNMKGQFFPKQSNFNGKFHQLSMETALYWAPQVIKSNAWAGRTNENRITSYKTGTTFSVLAKQGRWKFVLMHGAPISETNQVINSSNFSNTWIYGWIR